MLILGWKDSDAEINALIAYINEEKTIANFVNLASLAAMRKDQQWHEWINEAEKLIKIMRW